ncbi:MAG: hypothetical protein JXJ20_12275 [Anaerolineae bacterium]|jgi:hypothetical protein|nr:hypothetical protein [Anaerolineae bacterium]
MDIQQLVDRLEDLIDEGRHFPFSKFTLIDEERALEIIDQMRISIPEQIEKAARLINKRDRIMAHAQEEAQRIVDLASAESNDLVKRDAIVQTAQNRAANIIDQSQRDAEAIRADADQYVLQVLKELEGQLIRNLTVTRNGIAKVAEEQDIRQTQRQMMFQQPAPGITAGSPEMVEAAPQPDVSDAHSDIGVD